MRDFKSHWTPRTLVLVILLGLACLAWGWTFASPATWHADCLGKQRRCTYGTLGGRWLPVEEANRTIWQTYDPHCQLKRLLDQHLDIARGKLTSAAQPGPAKITSRRALAALAETEPQRNKHKIGILFFGDSVDRETVLAVCNSLNKTAPNFRPEGNECEWRCRVCDLPTLTMVNQMIWSSHPHPPYHTNKQTPTPLNVQQAVQHFKQGFGRGPDVVVVSSNLWDIARMVHHVKDQVVGATLPEVALQEWIHDVTGLFQLIKKEAAGAEFIYHTTAFPMRDFEADQGAHLNPNTGKRGFVSQINAAGRYVAASNGFQLVDLELMTSSFWAAEQYLMDRIHPAPFVTLELANIYLNLLEYKRSLTGHS